MSSKSKYKVYIALKEIKYFEKKIIIALIFICILPISVKIFQFNKISNYYKEEKFYTEEFQSDFNDLIVGFDYYDGRTSALSNESAIKNSVSAVAALGSIMHFTAYRQSKPMSEMLLYLSQFFVLNSNEFVNKNIDIIKPQLDSISKNLTDDKAIKNFNIILWKMISQKQ